MVPPHKNLGEPLRTLRLGGYVSTFHVFLLLRPRGALPSFSDQNHTAGLSSSSDLHISSQDLAASRLSSAT